MHFRRLATRAALLFIIIAVSTFKAQSGPIAQGDSKFLGNIILNNESPPSNFADYWNQVTCADQGKWGNVEPSRDQMNWAGTDAAYNYAKKKGFPFKHHCFFWDLQKPGWISGLSADDQKAEALEWIKAFADRYPETEYIDVVNEPRDHTPAFSGALGGKGETGWDWIVWAFETARKYCPNALLLINEHNVEANMTNALIYRNIIVILHQKHLVDGVGIQCHTADIQRNNASLDTIKRCIDTLASAGVPLYPSEFDLEGDDRKQLADYQKIFPFLWEHPSTKGVTLWGYQGQIWNTGAVLIQNGAERPALKWLRTYVDSLKKPVEVHAAGQIIAATTAMTIDFQENGTVRIMAPSAREGTLKFADLRGRTVFSRTINLRPSDGRALVIPAPSLPSGLYCLTVNGSNRVLSRKIFLHR